MRTRLHRVFLGALLMLAPTLAFGYQEYQTPAGASVTGNVQMQLNGSGLAVPVSPSAPVPTTPSPGTNSAPFQATATLSPFTVTSSDQALTGLTLPGKVCLTLPQQAFGSTAINTSYVNVSWTGGNSATSPGDQLAPGQNELCAYVTVAPHVSTNGGAASVQIGVMQ